MGKIKVEVPEGVPLDDMKKKQEKKILDKYYGIIKLDRTISIEEILELEEDTWLY